MLVLDEMDKLLMIPGPTPVQREILDALGQPTISHGSARIAEIIRRCQTGIRDAAGTAEGEIFLFGGAGTLAQEAAVVNLVAPGETLVVASNGFFGDRFVPLAEAYGIRAERVAAEWGQSVTPEMLDAHLAGTNARAVTITQIETSTGTMAPVADLAAVAKRHGALVIVDAVCALGGVETRMDEWGVDVLLSGAQKALGVPPGLAILAVSRAGMERRRARDRIPSYYADLLNWEPSMRDPQVYFSTHAVNEFYALAAAVEIIGTEGLGNRFARHERIARSFRARMESLGFSPLTAPDYFAPTMSVMAIPEGTDASRLIAGIGARGVVAAGCLGEWKGRGLRFGHMGNITEAEVLRALAAVEAAVLEMAPEPAGRG